MSRETRRALRRWRTFWVAATIALILLGAAAAYFQIWFSAGALLAWSAVSAWAGAYTARMLDEK